MLVRRCRPQRRTSRRPAVTMLGVKASAVYRWRADDGRLLYVGVTDNWDRRSREHAARSPWFGRARYCHIVWYSTRAEADAAERAAIRSERPAYNRQGTGSARRARRPLLVRLRGRS